MIPPRFLLISFLAHLSFAGALSYFWDTRRLVASRSAREGLTFSVMLESQFGAENSTTERPKKMTPNQMADPGVIPQEGSQSIADQLRLTKGAAIENLDSAPLGSPETWLEGRVEFRPSPIYPMEARRLGRQGTVTLKIISDAEGSVSSALVLHSSGYAELDEAALEAVQQWRLRGAKEIAVPFEFRINDI